MGCCAIDGMNAGLCHGARLGVAACCGAGLCEANSLPHALGSARAFPFADAVDGNVSAQRCGAGAATPTLGVFCTGLPIMGP